VFLGMNGIEFEARNILFEAESGSIHISAEKDIVFDTEEFYIDPRGLPIGGDDYHTDQELQDKLCICEGNKRVFSIPETEEGADCEEYSGFCEKEN